MRFNVLAPFLTVSLNRARYCCGLASGSFDICNTKQRVVRRRAATRFAGPAATGFNDIHPGTVRRGVGLSVTNGVWRSRRS